VTDRRFDTDTLDLLEREREVEIQTVRADGTVQRTIIWVVVEEGQAFIRSWRGDRARWFRAALDRPADVALVAAGRRIPAHPVPATDPQSIARCSRALERKYAGDASTPSMLRPEILDTTLRLEPRSE
jgi:hypothetical protein